MEDVVGEFVVLKKRGSNLQGLCPFHNEKSPSFSVNPARNIYKCFGCGKAGGPVTFLMDSQQMTYPDALKYLAAKYNIEIEETYDEGDQKEAQEKQNLTEAINIANAYAQKYFTEYMNTTDEGKVGLAYFKERGFLQHTIEKFQLGYAPDGGDTFTKHALKNGFQLDILKKAGVTSPKEGSTYDFFRNRVMFPIHNATGKVVGFGGRIMVKDEKSPKYVNTGESEVYNKSKILYGLYFAKGEIRKKDECLLVEGYTDVISMVQAGVQNVVSSSGTALTIDQIRIIKRITNNITMVYDGDAAGIKAALRGTDMILEEGMNVRIVVLPEQEDPDSFVRKMGAEGFEEYIKLKRKDVVLFKASTMAYEGAQDPVRKTEILREIIQTIALIPDPILRQLYTKECSQLLDFQEQILVTEVNKLRRQKVKKQDEDKQKEYSESISEPISGEQQKPLPSKNDLPLLEENIIRVLIDFGAWPLPVEGEEITVTEFILHELDGLNLEVEPYAGLYNQIKENFSNGVINDAAYYINHEDHATAQLAITLLADKFNLSKGWWDIYKIPIPTKRDIYIKDIQSTLLNFKRYKNTVEQQKFIKLISETQDETERTKLYKLYLLLIEQNKEFMRQSGTVVYRPNT